MGGVRKTIVIIVFLGLTLHQAGQAQVDSIPAIQVITKSIENGVVIRWAPNNPMAWRLANDGGYRLVRYTMESEKSLDYTEKIELMPGGLQVFSEEEWAPLMQDNKWAAIAAQAIFGEYFELTTPQSDPATLVNVAEELENRFSFALLAADMSTDVAKASALHWVDGDAKKGVTYVYRVELLNQKEGFEVAHGSSLITHGEPEDLPAPGDIEVDFGNRSARVSWNTFYLNRIYTSYQVERSEDGGKTFSVTDDLQFFALNKEGSGPLESMYFLDSIPENNVLYHYRVRGRSPFGELGPPSVAVSGKGMDTFGDAIPAIERAEVQPDGSVSITWKFNTQLENLIDRYAIIRGSKASGPFETIGDVPMNTHVFSDKQPMPVNYYVIIAEGKNGERRRSFPAMVQLEDSLPPAAPTGLEGEIDQKGIITLTWNRNKEYDLYGYRVYRANAVDEEYVQVTRDVLKQAQFRDSVSMKTLTEEVVYMVTSQDIRYNQSAYSAPLILKRPDLIAPPKMVLNDIIPESRGVRIRWQPSPAVDLAYFELRRRVADSTTWRVFQIPGDSTWFLDAPVLPNRKYEYSLMAVDDDGNTSEPLRFVAAPEKEDMPVLDNIKSEVDRKSRIIRMSWQYDLPYKEVVVYRSVNKGPFRLFGYAGAEETVFNDRQLQVGGYYEYRMKVVDQQGNESAMSEAIKIQF